MPKKGKKAKTQEDQERDEEKEGTCSVAFSTFLPSFSSLLPFVLSDFLFFQLYFFLKTVYCMVVNTKRCRLN